MLARSYAQDFAPVKVLPFAKMLKVV